MLKKIVLCGFLILSGCSLDKQTHDHITSCGALSIESLLIDDRKSVNSKEVSQYILENNWFGDSLRNFLGFIDRRMYSITFPAELENTLNHYGYKFTLVYGDFDTLKDLVKKKHRGIVLIHNTSDWNYHWIEFPQPGTEKTAYIEGYFGNNTVVVLIYVVY